ncbi:bifunctional 2-keto-4-hydroxyglutarate aldolase/2-keto-3-deoxy-6-phosphogluconate aldolase [Clostridium paraputrificum]|uniref:bifunctional 2-keto-4-hydroxyglutarate aldolase/2-keto-3-deoxy-6-phosphogluconate aldolase n=1 Tax=Clostridium paraputrificum TaxID=29363 RepID=UPI003D345150
MVLEELKENGIVAVVRGKNHEEAISYIEACLSGGIKAIELTYTIPNVNELIEKYRDKKNILVGAGSVLNGKMAVQAIKSGAKYIVSPGYNEEVDIVCKSYEVLYLPGCMTVSEMMKAMEQGNKMIKLFPGDLFGPKFVKAVKAPIPGVEIMPTGGVTLENMEEWFKNGVSCVGVGSSLLTGKISEIEERAKKFVDKFEEIKDRR